MKAIVLAGGMGTRLSETVPDLPKPMAPVAGRPFIEYILDKLVSSCIDEVILSVGYKADKISSHIGKSYKGLTIRYVYEVKPLGTGGAILKAINEIPKSKFLVLNGDTFLDINYTNFIGFCEQCKSSVVIVLKEISDISRYGAVEINDSHITKFVEKGRTGPGLINAGVYCIDSSLFERFDIDERFGFEAFLNHNCASILPGYYLTSSYFIDIGIPEDYERAQIEMV